MQQIIAVFQVYFEVIQQQEGQKWIVISFKYKVFWIAISFQGKVLFKLDQRQYVETEIQISVIISISHSFHSVYPPHWFIYNQSIYQSVACIISHSFSNWLLKFRPHLKKQHQTTILLLAQLPQTLSHNFAYLLQSLVLIQLRQILFVVFYHLLTNPSIHFTDSFTPLQDLQNSLFLLSNFLSSSFPHCSSQFPATFGSLFVSQVEVEFLVKLLSFIYFMYFLGESGELFSQVANCPYSACIYPQMDAILRELFYLYPLVLVLLVLFEFKLKL